MAEKEVAAPAGEAAPEKWGQQQEDEAGPGNKSKSLGRTHHVSGNVYTGKRFRVPWWVHGENENKYFRYVRDVDPDTLLAALVFDTAKVPAQLYELVMESLVDLKEAPGVVADAWSSTEYPERCLSTDKWVDLFGRAGYTHDFKPDWRPTEPVTVYRGCTPEGREGMAWTSDLEVARRFARKAGRPRGHVYTFDAPPDALLAYIWYAAGLYEENEYVISNAFLKGAVRLFEK